MAVGPTRRAVLAASAAAVPLLLSACRGVQALGTPPPPAPDIRRLRSAIAAEQLLVDRYRAAAGHAVSAGAGQSAAAVLSGLLAEHEQHLAQLRSRLVEPGGQPVQGSPAPGSSAAVLAGLGGQLTSPAGFAAAIAALAADEQSAASRLSAQLLTAPASLAQLMASISASEATHVPVLDALRRTL
ncbi:MAG TPA: hypothetical protein VEL03_05460 [Streptosporangiaceae bacterium]|nr:hypothetical protein [Streptosporangiaceae bacterium]